MVISGNERMVDEGIFSGHERNNNFVLSRRKQQMILSEIPNI